jgi:hypothetical protein
MRIQALALTTVSEKSRKLAPTWSPSYFPPKLDQQYQLVVAKRGIHGALSYRL